MTNILNGKEIASKRLASLSAEIGALKKNGASLNLATLHVGCAKDSEYYSRAIENLLKKLSLDHSQYKFQETINEQDLCRQVAAICADKKNTGLLIFSPLPKKFSSGDRKSTRLNSSHSQI